MFNLGTSAVAKGKPKPPKRNSALQEFLRQTKQSLPFPAAQPGQTKSASVDVHATLTGLYSVDQRRLGRLNKTRLQKELTLYQKQHNQDGPGAKLEAFWETDTQFSMPRFYGLKTFGVPKTQGLSVGAPMHDIKTTFQPDPERHQPQAMYALERGLAKPGWHGGMLCLPCGFGKTALAIATAIQIVGKLEGRPRRTLVIVHNSILLEQWQQRLLQFAPEAKVGVIRQNRCEVDGFDFVVGMVQSLVKRNYPGLDTFGMVILDEAHHMAAPYFQQALPKLRAKYLLALSATMRRKDGLEPLLHYFMGDVLFHRERHHMVDEVKVQVKRLIYAGGQQKVVQKGKHVIEPLMARCLAADRGRNEVILQQIARYYRDPQRKILVLSTLMDRHLKPLLQTLTRKRLDVGLLEAKVKDPTIRREALSRRIVLATYRMAKEGLDEPFNTLIFALPRADVEQAIGRITRGDQDGPEPIAIDMVDPFSCYDGYAYCRKTLYRRLKYPCEDVEVSSIVDQSTTTSLAVVSAPANFSLV